MNKLKKILLVEDSKNDIDLTLMALKKRHLANQVDIVRDGAEALDYIYCEGKYSDRNHVHPAVILLDLKMPKVDGLEVLEKLKSDPEKKIIPVVVLTSSKQDPDLIRCYELGVNAYVVKPVNFHEFAEVISNLGLFWAVINENPPDRE